MKKKQSKTTAIPPTTQQPAHTTPSSAPVALLIDGENVSAPLLIAQIVEEVGTMGVVVIRQVYGNWVAPSMQPWKDVLTEYALEPIGNGSSAGGHNATDIALVIGAMDLLHRGVRQFCLVAGDSDYVPLVHRLRQAGCLVLGIGTPKASEALKDACTRFLTTDHLQPSRASAPSKPASSPPPLPPRKGSDLSTLLTQAYLLDANKSGRAWIPRAALGIALKQLSPQLQKTHGKHRLTTLIAQCPGLFETRQRETAKGHVDEIRLREQDHRE